LVAIAAGVTYAVADIGSGGVINGCYKPERRRSASASGSGVERLTA
jgi:hypothetical protein